MFAPVGVRRRKNHNGRSGCETRDSISRNATINAVETSKRAIVCVEPQPFWLACVSA